MFPDNVHVADLWTALLSSQNVEQNFPGLLLAFSKDF